MGLNLTLIHTRHILTPAKFHFGGTLIHILQLPRKRIHLQGAETGVPGLEQELEQVLEARQLQGSVPVRSQGEHHKQQEPRQRGGQP